jgi:8-oxo-dGTP pyrophosphatase MutT (NUDIX family)
MRRRLSARFLIVDPAKRVLLFRFVHTRGPLAGHDHWGTPGGGVEDGETLEQAALRELQEETGLRREHVGSEVARREVALQLPDGEHVLQDERFFLVRVVDNTLSQAGWTDFEREVMVEHRWWTLEELANTRDTVWPERLREMVEAAFP